MNEDYFKNKKWNQEDWEKWVLEAFGEDIEGLEGKGDHLHYLVGGSKATEWTPSPLDKELADSVIKKLTTDGLLDQYNLFMGLYEEHGDIKYKEQAEAVIRILQERGEKNNEQQ